MKAPQRQAPQRQTPQPVPPFSIDFAILLLKRDEKRRVHVDALVRQHPYFHIREAVDARDNWAEVEKTFVENGIQVTASFDPRPGKYGRWASFIQWLKWMKDVAQPAGIHYGVLVEDDVSIIPDFKQQLNRYLHEHPERWYFRCGPYNSCLVVRCDMVQGVWDRLLETGVDMPDDHWAWKSGKVLQHRGPSFVKQLPQFQSNINVPDRIKGDKNPRMWKIKNLAK